MIVDMEIKVYGIEKYLISLKVTNTLIPKKTPIDIKNNPGIPKYRKG